MEVAIHHRPAWGVGPRRFGANQLRSTAAFRVTYPAIFGLLLAFSVAGCSGSAPSASPTVPATRVPSPGAGPSATPKPTLTPTPTPTLTPTPTPSPTPTPPPWKASTPFGRGRTTYLAVDAPWDVAPPSAAASAAAGAPAPLPATVEVAIYLPPGYDTSGAKRYPAVYEAPFTFGLWNDGIGVESMLDDLITSGKIPPSLFVFISSGAGPYADPECANTFDGREKMDDFMGVTVPTYVDSHYRTIARPAARAIMGMSEGGYCAAILILHHPDVFGSAISFSGYYTAGAAGIGTRPPFGDDPVLIAKDSPTYQATSLASSVRSGLYFVIVAQASQEFYGPQATSFAKILDHAGITYYFVQANSPHGWNQVADYFGQTLIRVGTHQAELGVFD